MMMRPLILTFVTSLLVSALFSAGAHAQSVPLAPQSLTGQLGFESVGGPVVVVDVAPRPFASGILPFAEARIDTHTASVALVVGGQLEQDISDWFFVREAAGVGLFVSAVDGVAGGLRGDAALQLGFRIFSVVLVTGPTVGGALAVDGAVDGRVSPGWDTALVVPVVDHAAVVGHVNAGYDLGGHGDGAFRGGAFIGARFSL